MTLPRAFGPHNDDCPALSKGVKMFVEFIFPARYRPALSRWHERIKMQLLNAVIYSSNNAANTPTLSGVPGKPFLLLLRPGDAGKNNPDVKKAPARP
ncbi:MAG: hypothetical protein LBF61_10650 [Azoarcus sp.]|nr:hypothetical protein [Azoarcus sp.]